jgi:predicted phosphodiesterase
VSTGSRPPPSVKPARAAPRPSNEHKRSHHAPKTQKLLLVPDVHGEYRDKRAWTLMMKAMHWWRPEIVGALGDLIDAYSLSFFDRDPNRVTQLEDEVDTGKTLLADLSSLKPKRKFLCEGNHEERLRRLLMRQAPALFNTVKIEKLLELEENGWEFHPYRTFTRVGKLYVTHDLGNSGARAHIQARDVLEGNVVIGHTHMACVAYRGNLRQNPHVGIMSGWLGDFEQIEYLHRAKAAEWQLAFTIGHLEPASGIVHLQLIPIIVYGNKYRCVVDGKLFTG